MYLDARLLINNDSLNDNINDILNSTKYLGGLLRKSIGKQSTSNCNHIYDPSHSSYGDQGWFKVSRASLTVRILGYEIEKGL